MMNIRKKSKQNKGFTLVELVVVLVIMGIVLALSAGGILAWQDWSRFRSANETAQTLYTVATNQLTEYAANGVLGDFQDRISHSEGNFKRQLDLTKLISKDGEAYNIDEVWYERNVTSNESEKAKFQGTLVYAMCKPGDYSEYCDNRMAYLRGEKSFSNGAEIVFELLENYLYDKSILNNAISIEFSAEDGQVFAVLFSDKCQEFSYAATDSEGKISIVDRQEDARRPHMIGYYGVDTLAKYVGGQNKKPTISSLSLNNEETLNLSFKVKKYPEAVQNLVYSVDVYDKDTKEKIISLKVDGSKLHNYDSRSNIPSPATIYTKNASGEVVETDLGTINILAWIDSNQKVRIVLDAADIQATTTQYIDDLVRGLGTNTTNSFATQNTLSFHRFGLDVDNIYCTVQGSGNLYKTTAKRTSNSEAVYYETASLVKSNSPETNNVFNYTISNARHLYNIRYMEDLDYAQFATAIKRINSGVSEVKYKVTKDIDWDKFVTDGNLYFSEGAIRFGDVSGTVVAYATLPGVNVAKYMSVSTFPSIKQLRYEDSITSGTKNGVKANNNDPFTIKNISFSESDNGILMLYANSVPGAQNQNSGSGDDGDIIVKGPTGLFANNFGSITDLYLDGVRAEGTDKVGAFCGSNGGTLENLEVKNTDNASKIKGKTNVGGVMGYIETINDTSITGNDVSERKFEKLTNRAKVEGNKYVGGIVGMVHVPQTTRYIPKITISECENYGGVIGVDEVNTPSKYIGGITGFSNNEYIVPETGKQDVSLLTISDCISSPEYSDVDLVAMLDRSVESAADEAENRLEGTYVGGIVGYNYYGTLNESSTRAESGKAGYVFGYEFVGGIVGFNQGPISGLSEEQPDKQGVNEANVIGYQYVGGIIGCNAGIDEDATAKRAIEEGVDVSEVTVVPDTDRYMVAKVDNWINEGVVFATSKYAGGITGYNTGWLYNCNSQVDKNDKDDFFQTTYSGDYAGGIAGYNNGIIGNTIRDEENQYVVADDRSVENKKISAICYISGNNYVGGVVGYNDEEAVVEDYEIAGGHIRGNTEESCFVGGYAGLNASVNLLMDEEGNARTLYSNPNEVEGQYFVGGCIGGNIINTNNHKANGDIDPDPDPVDPPTEEPTTEEPTTEEPTTEEPTTEAPTTENPGDEPVYGSGFAKLEGGTWSDGNRFFTQASIMITNTSEDPLVHNSSENTYFYVDFSSSPYDFDVIQTNNCTFDTNTKILKSAYDWQAIGAGTTGNCSIQLQIACDKEDELKALFNMSFPVGSAKGSNTVSSFINKVLGASYLGKCTVDISKYSSWSEGGKAIGSYGIVINNISGQPLSDWRIYIDVPEGTTIHHIDYGTYEIVGNKLVVTAPAGNATLWNNMHLGVQLAFIDEAEVDKFPDNHIQVFFGDDIYYDSDPEDTEEPTTEEPTTEEPTTEEPTTEEPTTEDPNPVDPVDPEPLQGIITKYKTDNFLGQINGTAFVGGYAGYNILVKNNDKDNPVKYVYELQDAMVDKMLADDTLANKFGIINDIEHANLDISEAIKPAEIIFEIEGVTGNSVATNTLGLIAADICVGGVLGYNAESTPLRIINVFNTSPVLARDAIVFNEQNGRNTDYLGYPLAEPYKYSYGGGIIGKVSRNTTIFNCANTSSARVQTEGTYTGGICEVNEGTVEHCRANTFGSSVDDYIGGICGLNKSTGTIKKCSIEDITITGRNVVGGVCAENFGSIEDISLNNFKANVAGTMHVVDDAYANVDGVVGSIVGYNGSTGNISISDNISGIYISSKGSYVGGIVGINEGTLNNSSATVVNPTTVGGVVMGLFDVGGVVGVNNSKTTGNIQYYRNNALVSALNGNAGGIIGFNESENTIQYCTNFGIVSATNTGNAGGITAINASKIRNCQNYSEIKAPNGMCGGISSDNLVGGTIEECIVEPVGIDRTQDLNLQPRLAFASKDAVGGVVATNAGTIKKCKVTNLDIYDFTSSQNSSIGAIAGINYKSGAIRFEANEEAINNCTVKTYTNYGFAGGVAGRNAGTITGELKNVTVENPVAGKTYKLPASYVRVDVGFKPDGTANVSNFGGIAGYNEADATISNISVYGNIRGLLGGAGYGYGGVAGKNEGTVNKCTFDGVCWADGTAQAVASIGGIVGLNEAKGVVESCVIGVSEEDGSSSTKIYSGKVEDENGEKTKDTVTAKNGDLYYITKAFDTKAFANIGGVVGSNYGSVLGSDNKTYSKDNVSVEYFNGYGGGIVGFNYADASVTGTADNKLSTAEKWAVTGRIFFNNGATAGVVAYTNSYKPIEYAENYATVTNMYPGNGYVAGILSMYTAMYEPTNLRLRHVYNYANIYSASNAAGVLGDAMYAHVWLDDCVNYGDIYNLVQQANKLTSGLWAHHYLVINTGDNRIENCRNYGDIYVSTGYKSTSPFFDKDTSVLYAYNCVNTGNIYQYDTTLNQYIFAKTTEASSFTQSDKNGDSVGFELCRNYSNNSVLVPYTRAGKKPIVVNSLNASGRTDTGDAVTKPFSTSTAISYGSRTNFFIGKQNGNTTKNDTFTELRPSSRSGGSYTLKANLNSSVTSATNALSPTVKKATATISLNNSPALDDDYFNETVSYNSSKRKQLYDELDEKYLEYIYKLYEKEVKLANPTNVKFEPFTTTDYENNRFINNYMLEFTPIKDAYGYEGYYILKDAAGNVVYTSPEEHIVSCRVNSNSASYKIRSFFDMYDIQQNYENNGGEGAYTITLKFRACNGYHKLHNTNGDIYDSDYVEITTKNTPKLPRPEVHIEATDGGYYVGVLDNVDEYQLLQNEAGESCAEVYISVLDQLCKFDLSTGTTEPCTGIDSARSTDKPIYSYAIPTAAGKTAGYIQSDYYNAKGRTMGTNQYTSTGNGSYANTVTFKGFYGKDLEGLTYVINYNTNNSQYKMVSELLAKDDNLGINVAYASGLSDVSGNGSSVDTACELLGFGNDIADKDVIVRTYPYSSQKEIVYYGHHVADNITIEDKENLAGIVDAHYINVSAGVATIINNPICNVVRATDGSISSIELKKGYTVMKNLDGTYNVLYSASLEQYDEEATTYFGTSVAMYKYTESNDNSKNDYYSFRNNATAKITTGTTPAMQPRPIISDEYVKATDENGHTTFTFSWKSDKATSLHKNADYALELFGTTVSGTKVSLATVTSILNDSNCKNNNGTFSYIFTDTEDNWNYSELTLQVTRLGTVNASGVTTIMPRRATKDFSVKLKLTTIAAPDVSLKRNQDGSFDKNGLKYNIEWSAISDADELKDLGGYLIKVEVKEAVDGYDKTKTHFYYVQDIQNEDASDDTIGLDLEAFEDAIVKEIPAEGYTSGTLANGMCKTMIDLSDFIGGEIVDISVKAVARVNSVNFTDGDFGEAYTLDSIPQRIKTPNVSEMQGIFNSTADASQNDGSSLRTALSESKLVVDIAELEKGKINILLTDSNYNNTISGNYELAIALYDKDEKANMQADDSAKDGGIVPVAVFGDGQWNQDAYLTIASKEAPVKMSGNKLGAECKYEVLLPEGEKLADCAGMWLKIAVRAISPSKISSFWTDEDPEVDATVNYYYVQIPEAKLGAPKLEMDASNRYYDNITKVWSRESDRIGCVVENKELVIPTSKYADGYEVSLIDKAKDHPIDSINLANNVGMIYFDAKADGVYDVYFAGAKDSADNQILSDELYEFNGNVYNMYLGEISNSADEIRLPYAESFVITEFGLVDSENVITLEPWVYIDEDGNIRIMLPDINKVSKTGPNNLVASPKYSFTDSIMVQSVVSEDNPKYQNSDVRSWTSENGEDSFDIIDVVDNEGSVITPDDIERLTVGDVVGEVVEPDISAETQPDISESVVDTVNSNADINEENDIVYEDDISIEGTSLYEDITSVMTDVEPSDVKNEDAEEDSSDEAEDTEDVTEAATEDLTETEEETTEETTEATEEATTEITTEDTYPVDEDDVTTEEPTTQSSNEDIEPDKDKEPDKEKVGADSIDMNDLFEDENFYYFKAKEDAIIRLIYKYTVTVVDGNSSEVETEYVVRYLKVEADKCFTIPKIAYDGTVANEFAANKKITAKQCGAADGIYMSFASGADGLITSFETDYVVGKNGNLTATSSKPYEVKNKDE